MQALNNIPIREVLLVMYGGLFGYVLGNLPRNWVYVVLGIAILLTIVAVL